MRRVALLLTIAGLALGTLAIPVSAAPAKTEPVSLDCGEVTLVVLVRTDNGGVATFDASLETNGRQYVLSSLRGRFYEGELTADPGGEPLFSFGQTWGKRKGYSQFFECTSEPFAEEDDGEPLTAFFDVVLAGK